MSRDIRMGVHRLEHVITQAKGPIFTDADYGRVLRSFLDICGSMEAQDQHFKEQAEEAARIERVERQKREAESLQRLIDELGCNDD
jgi:hypothetical protein